MNLIINTIYNLIEKPLERNGKRIRFLTYKYYEKNYFYYY